MMSNSTKVLPPLPANLGQVATIASKVVATKHCRDVRAVIVMPEGELGKAMCKALKAVGTQMAKEILEAFNQFSFSDYKGSESDNASAVASIIRISKVLTPALEQELGRPLRRNEHNLIGWDLAALPVVVLRCSSESIRTLGARGNNSRHSDHALTANSHSAVLRSIAVRSKLFTKAPHVPMIRMVARSISSEGEFEWYPERIKASWETLKGLAWRSMISDLKEDMFGMPLPDVSFESLLRCASESLSMIMTILWALECLNGGDAWTRKKTLNIHFLGPGKAEINHRQVFEEILHRLPLVKNVKLTLCGPGLTRIVQPADMTREFGISSCPQCSQKGRRIGQFLVPATYHTFVKAKGELFEKPDLAIAFNSGCSEEERSSWKETIKLLVKLKIPSVFTACYEQEARDQADVFRAAGANLVEDLGPKPNPWGSCLLKMEPRSIGGFYAANKWISGGFR